MRWIIAAVIVAVLLVGVATAGVLAHVRSTGASSAPVASKPSTCAEAYKLLGLRPSQITSARTVCVVESLKFSGEVAGRVGEAYPVNADDPGPAAVCAVPHRWDGFPQALLAMVVGTKAYRLRIAIPGRSEHQAITVNNLANQVELAAISDPNSDWNQATGSLTVNPDGITGTIDASLLRDATGAQPVHVRGQWACGAPLAAPAADPSVPCSGFYALNQLQPVDVARIKASGCNAQDLTFSGDVAGHVDQAVTDLPNQSVGELSRDNSCSQAFGEYLATLKFSIGDESFLLDLDIYGYPSVGPGQHPAVYANGNPAAELYLGSADPGNHGIFVDDHRVEWDASAGTITIAPDMKSGTLELDLGGPPYQVFSNVHVSGSWRCAA